VHRTDVVIVGAGQAGLAMSHELSAAGRDHVVLDRGRVGERWQSECWDSLRLLTPNWMTRLPGWAYTGDDPDGFTPAADVARFLHRYAGSFGAPVQEGTTVLDVRPADRGYRVTTDRGAWTARSVVVATGHADPPARPRVAGALPGSIGQLDARAYRSPAGLPDGAVLVVGSSASGIQVADELCRAGRDVVLASGSHTRLPRRYRGRDILSWMDRTGVLDQTLDEVADPDSARRQPSLQLVGRPDHSDLDLSTVAARGVLVTGRLVGAHGTTVSLADDLARTAAAADARLRRLLAAVDEHIARHGGPADAPDAPRPVRLPPAPTSLDLRAAGVRTVVWATGYRRSYPWLRVPVVDPAGDIVHRRGVTAAPGLYVLGMRFQHRRSSAFIDGVRHDARYLTEHVLGRAPAARAA
jgi:putative flavoprotein involved in K+ transport